MASSHCLRLRPLASGLARPSAKLSAQQTTLLPITAARYKSGPYGYTQAKALVFSKPGEPSDVLRYILYISIFLTSKQTKLTDL